MTPAGGPVAASPASPPRHSRHPAAAARWRRAWASPWTLLGLCMGGIACLWGARVQRVDGIWEFDTRLPPRRPGGLPWPCGALTLGHVVLGSSAGQLQALRLHEQEHVRQYERWGPAFVPAYLAAGLWQWLQGRHAYHDNPFERQARAAEDRARADPGGNRPAPGPG